MSGGVAPAIETSYGGYRFRSRLEARYAVLFDRLGLRWEYEREGYELPHGRYLPDFWLPDLLCHGEVKPDSDEALHEIGCARHADLVRSVSPLIYLFGPPAAAPYALLGACEHGRMQAHKIDLALSAHSRRVVPWCSHRGGHRGGVFRKAVRAALGARFEHGETPT